MGSVLFPAQEQEVEKISFYPNAVPVKIHQNLANQEPQSNTQILRN
jgi:hypothetical protein